MLEYVYQSLLLLVVLSTIGTYPPVSFQSNFALSGLCYGNLKCRILVGFGVEVKGLHNPLVALSFLDFSN